MNGFFLKVANSKSPMLVYFRGFALGHNKMSLMFPKGDYSYQSIVVYAVTAPSYIARKFHIYLCTFNLQYIFLCLQL